MSRRCIITAASFYSEAWVARIIPPEHKIIAIKDDGGKEIDYLVEGPWLPEGDPQSPPRLIPIMTIHPGIDLNGPVKLTAAWFTLPSQGWKMGEWPAEWTIGEWPSYEAYRAEMNEIELRAS